MVDEKLMEYNMPSSATSSDFIKEGSKVDLEDGVLVGEKVMQVESRSLMRNNRFKLSKKAL